MTLLKLWMSGQLKIWMASRFTGQVALRASGILGRSKTPENVLSQKKKCGVKNYENKQLFLQVRN